MPYFSVAVRKIEVHPNCTGHVPTQTNNSQWPLADYFTYLPELKKSTSHSNRNTPNTIPSRYEVDIYAVLNYYQYLIKF